MLDYKDDRQVEELARVLCRVSGESYPSRQVLLLRGDDLLQTLAQARMPGGYIVAAPSDLGPAWRRYELLARAALKHCQERENGRSFEADDLVIHDPDFDEVDEEEVRGFGLVPIPREMTREETFRTGDPEVVDEDTDVVDEDTDVERKRARRAWEDEIARIKCLTEETFGRPPKRCWRYSWEWISGRVRRSSR